MGFGHIDLWPSRDCIIRDSLTSKLKTGFVNLPVEITGWTVTLCFKSCFFTVGASSCRMIFTFTYAGVRSGKNVLDTHGETFFCLNEVFDLSEIL